jgi:uncharacterized membrane protein (UPF0182 family)
MPLQGNKMEEEERRRFKAIAHVYISYHTNATKAFTHSQAIWRVYKE